ncbi:MAG: WXG100 family type VII secretion target [Clostridia bacterium]|nr:WXG100 family type VII secretion target [Clostridia bacterium]
MDRITIDFENTLRKANELEEQAQRLRRMTAGEYESTMQSLSNDWQSDNSGAFFAKGDRLRREIEQTATDIERVANNLRAVARRIYEAERQAEALAQQRTANS